MPVTQIIYLSRATQHIDRPALAQITEVSARNNQQMGVTGALMFCDGYFLQILEGEAQTLKVLLEKIDGDARHVDLQVIRKRSNVQREFAGWAMASMHEESMDTELAARMSKCIAILGDEDLVNHIGNDAHQLLVDMRTSIAA